MFERLTLCARKTMALANQEAQRFNHTWIGPEHILLGLLYDTQCVAVRVLTNLGTDLQRLRRDVTRRMKEGPPAVTMGILPQASGAKKVIEEAILAARSMDHKYVGSEHLLLGLLRVGKGLAFEAMAALGIAEDVVRKEVMRVFASGEVESRDEQRGEGFAAAFSPADTEVGIEQRLARLEAVVERLVEEVRALRKRLEDD